MRKFNIIKKSRKKSKDIDEKIEYLDKQCQKTGLNEITMSTSGIYVGTQSNPNSGYAEITGKNFNGRGLAMSGDSNLGQGNFGGASIRASDGAALSPPHPVTGERIVAYTKGSIGVGGSKIAIPGERRTPQHRMTGPIMWYWNSSYNFGGQQGRWQSLEYNAPGVHGNSPYPTYQAGWGYWGSGAFGLLLRNDGASYAGLFNTIDNFDPQDSIPETTVLTKDRLDNPGFLPINIGLSKEGFDYLKNKVDEELLAGTFDLMKRGQVPFLTPSQVDKILVDPKFQKLLQDDPDLLPILQRMRAQGNDGTQVAFFGGGNKPKPKPTRRSNKGTLEATYAPLGMGGMTPEKFFQKYGMTPEEYLNLPAN